MFLAGMLIPYGLWRTKECPAVVYQFFFMLARLTFFARENVLGCLKTKICFPLFFGSQRPHQQKKKNCKHILENLVFVVFKKKTIAFSRDVEKVERFRIKLS